MRFCDRIAVKLKPDQIAELRAVFDSIDDDGKDQKCPNEMLRTHLHTFYSRRRLRVCGERALGSLCTGSGSIDADELAKIFKAQGQQMSMQEVQDLIDEVRQLSCGDRLVFLPRS